MINQRKKGHGFERWVSNFLKKFFPHSKRHLEYQGEECLGVDLDNTSPFAIQCKRYKNISIYKWLEEIKDNSAIPILIAKADRKDPIIIGYLDDLAHLIFDPKLISIYHSSSANKVIVCNVDEDESGIIENEN